jgi:hypothetical protein
MSFNLPTNPSNGYIYTIGNRSWQWNGTYWKSTTLNIGFTGSIGYTGSQGSGYTGSASTVAGYWGSVGYTGSQGSGYTGSASTVAGYWGSVGYTGSASTVAGYWGSVGYTGSWGYFGSTGYTGSASTVIGYWGSVGYTGSIGPAGTSINVIGSYSTTASLPSTGQTIGDAYVITSTGHLWIYTNSSAGGNINGFIDAGTFVGYTGSTGTGYWGSVGYTGSIGAGYTGSASTVAGYTGSAGSGGGGGASVSISTTAPGSPTAGQFWYKSDEGKLYIYYDDGNSSQWVGITATIAGSAGVGTSGGVDSFVSSFLLGL